MKYLCLAYGDPKKWEALSRSELDALMALIDAILARGDLGAYHLAHSARADLCRRLGRTAEARISYQRALSLTRQEPERRFHDRRLSELRD